MPEIEDRLTPRDGLNNYHVFLTRMDLQLHGAAQFTFAVTHSMQPVAELAVSVPASGQNLDRMTVDAHDALIDILRQLLFRAEKARIGHEKNAQRHFPAPEPSETDAASVAADDQAPEDEMDGFT
jgi:hypothetical protein